MDNGLTEFISPYKELYLFGTGSYGKALYEECVKQGLNVAGFVLSCPTCDAENGIPVLSIEQFEARFKSKSADDIKLALAVHHKYYEEILPKLLFCGNSLCFIPDRYKRTYLAKSGLRAAVAPSTELRAAAALEKLIGEYTFETVLDVGAGAGNHSRIFRDNGKRVTAVTLSREWFDKSLLDSVEMVTADYTYYRFNRQFDAIWASHMLEHVRNIGLVLDKMNADLKDGGILVVSTPYAEVLAGGGHCNYFSPGHIIYHLLAAGFDLSNMRLHTQGCDLSIICHKNAEFEPDTENVTKSLREYRDRLPAYVNSAIEKLGKKTVEETGGPWYERIPLEIEYEW